MKPQHLQTSRQHSNHEPNFAKSIHLQPVQWSNGDDKNGEVGEDIREAYVLVRCNYVGTMPALYRLIPLEGKWLADRRPHYEACAEPVCDHRCQNDPSRQSHPWRAPDLENSQVQDQKTDLGQSHAAKIKKLGAHLKPAQ